MFLVKKLVDFINLGVILNKNLKEERFKNLKLKNLIMFKINLNLLIFLRVLVALEKGLNLLVEIVFLRVK